MNSELRVRPLRAHTHTQAAAQPATTLFSIHCLSVALFGPLLCCCHVRRFSGRATEGGGSEGGREREKSSVKERGSWWVVEGDENR